MKTKLTVDLPCEVHVELEPADGGVRLVAITAVLWPKEIVGTHDSVPMVHIPMLRERVVEALKRDETYGT